MVIYPFLVNRLGRVLLNNDSLLITQEPPRSLAILYFRIHGEGLYFILSHALSQVVLIQPDQAWEFHAGLSSEFQSFMELTTQLVI